MGLVGSVLVVGGALQPASPFTLKLSGAWWLGVPAATGPATHQAGRWQWLGLTAVYAGIVALLAAWYALATACRHGRGPSLWTLAGTWAAWSVPFVLGPPLMSRDVYAYAAQGALAARGADPYTTGLARLAGTPYLHLVDPLWRHATPPYGPAFLELARAAALVGGRSAAATVMGLRLGAVAGMVLLAVSVPVLARSYGRSPTTAFALAVMNPLLLITLVGGAHNDALMLGLLAAGLALARSGRPVAGVVLCAVAAAVKVPAFAGVVFIGWAAPVPPAPVRRRVASALAAVAGGAAVLAVVGAASGWGWRWLTAADPGKVVSWLDPATALGLLASRAMSTVGLGAHQGGAVAGARVLGLVAAAAIGLVLLWRSERMGLPSALGWALLAVAVLGPVVWPWYETWGLALIAVTAGTAGRRTVFALSALGCVATVPSSVSASGATLGIGAGILVLWTAGLGAAALRGRSVSPGSSAPGPGPPAGPDPLASTPGAHG